MTKNRIALLLTLVISAGATLGLLGRGHGKPQSPSTVPLSAVAPSRLRAEGRVVAYPGSDVSVSTEAGGTVVEVKVREGDDVRKGQVLAVFDSRRERAALDEARANLRETEANVRYLEGEVHRSEMLARGDAISRQSLDQVGNQLEVMKARREGAWATANRLRVALAKFQIVSPLGGRVLARLVQPGETVSPGSRLFQIAQTNHVRVEAEIDEYDLLRVSLAAPVSVGAEGSEQHWKGTVEEIPNQVVGRRLKPQDPARPSDTRVLLVKVALAESTPLKLGQRVELEIQPAQTN